MSNRPVKTRGSGLKTLDHAAVVVAGVVGVVVAFAALHFVVGFVWELVKVVVVVGVIGGVLWVIRRRRRS
jgi:Flp pilus assembly protein TadB